MNSITKKTLRAALAIGFTSATALAAGLPGANPVQAKYFARSGVDGCMCAPQGALKELIDSKYDCSGASGGDACPASIDAAKGTLDPKFIELFVDLMKKDPQIKKTEANRDGNLYAAGCSDLGGADYAQMLSPAGLSYAKAQPDVLIGQGTPENFKTWGAQEREDFVASIGRYGEPQKDKILPVLRTALTTPGQMLGFKKNALKLLARFGSDDGVAYCMDVLKQGNDKDVSEVCGYYLADRRTAAAAPILIRRIDDEREAFTRALGNLGSKEAIPGLKEEYEKRVGSQVATRATVALLNLGDKSYDYAGDLALLAQGRRPLSMNERQRKAEDMKSKRKGVGDRWKTREQEGQEDVARDAALELTYLTNAGAAGKVDEALRATAKRTDWPKASAMATSALAQRGDKGAAAALVKLLDSPKEDVRQLAVGAFGGSYDVPEAYHGYVGAKGIVVERAAVPALAKYIDNEPKAERRVNALRALGALRSFLP